MKLILLIIFWGLLGWLFNHLWGYIAVIIEILFILFVNIVIWDDEMKKLKEKKQ